MEFYLHRVKYVIDNNSSLCSQGIQSHGDYYLVLHAWRAYTIYHHRSNIHISQREYSMFNAGYMFCRFLMIHIQPTKYINMINIKHSISVDNIAKTIFILLYWTWYIFDVGILLIKVRLTISVIYMFAEEILETGNYLTNYNSPLTTFHREV